MHGAMTMDELRDALGDIREFMGRHDAKLENIQEQLTRQNGRVGKLEEAHLRLREGVAQATGAWKVVSAISALIGGGVAWAAKHFLPLLFLAAMYGQTATISDTLYSSVGGGAWTGKIIVTLNSPGSAQPLYSGTTSLASWSQTLCVGVTSGDCSTTTSAGVVTVTLYTNSAITPSGTSYNARFTPSRGGAWSETWTVSTGNTKLYQIRATTVPIPTVTFQVTQIVPGTNGQCLITSGGASAWGTCPGGGAPSGAAGGALAGTYPNPTLSGLTGYRGTIAYKSSDSASTLESTDLTTFGFAVDATQLYLYSPGFLSELSFSTNSNGPIAVINAQTGSLEIQALAGITFRAYSGNNGAITAASSDVFSNTATTGSTQLRVQAGQGQSTTNLAEWRAYHATMGSGTLGFSIASDLIPQWASVAEPTCNVNNRGKLVMVHGGAGVADTFRICSKDAADAYAYRTLI